MAKKVKCIDCYHSMHWALPDGVGDNNYEYSKHCLNISRNTIICEETMKTKSKKHEQYCKKYKPKDTWDKIADEVQENGEMELEEKIKEYENQLNNAGE